MEETLFQYCQKIVIFSDDFSHILLAKRKGELDYDGIFSFIGGKMEHTDVSIIEGIRREKEEEIGTSCTIRIYPTYTTNVLYQKKDGHVMILPHIFAVFEKGDIQINDEYSEFVWVSLLELHTFEPKIDNIPDIVKKFLDIKEEILQTVSVSI